jgi:hypothetical protein
MGRNALYLVMLGGPRGVIGGLVAALGNHVYQRRCHALAGVGSPGNNGRA